MYVINHFIDATNDISLISTEQIQKSEIPDIITTTVEVEEEITGEITEIDIVRGQQKSLKEKMGSLLVTLLEMICKEKDTINLNKKMVKEKINRAKDKERHKITTNLKNMEKEERQIEHLFKNHRLERWNKGQQKGLTQYVGKTYDEERAERESDEILEKILEEKELLGQAITVDREIAKFEQEEKDIVEARIDQDVYSLEDLPEDDEYADNMDDNYRLQFDDNEE